MSYIPQISIEGGDLTGKTTLQKALFHVIGKDLFVGDRNILTQYVYSQAFNRHTDNQRIWFKELIDYLCNNGMIFLVARDEDVIKRHAERGDDRYNINQILLVNKLYNNIASRFFLIPNVKIVNIKDKSVDQIVEEIKPWCKEIANSNMAHKAKNLYELIISFGDKVHCPSGDSYEIGREIRNITLKSHFNNKSFDPNQFSQIMEHWRKYIKNKEDHKEYKMAVSHHNVFYNAFREKLIYTIMKEMKMNYQSPVWTRRFHITNDAQGCINTLSVMFREHEIVADFKGIDVNVTANLRSSDMAILAWDLDGIFNLIADIIRPNKAIPIFGKGFTNKITDFFVNINIESAHVLDYASAMLHTMPSE